MPTHIVAGLAAMLCAMKTPFFVGLPDEPIMDFLIEYAELADRHGLLETQKIETILRYILHPLKDLWKSLSSYSSGSWSTFKNELEKLYPDMDAESQYSRQGLIELINLSSRTQMHDEKDIFDYYQRFLAICNPLHAAKQISDVERNSKFFQGFHLYCKEGAPIRPTWALG